MLPRSRVEGCVRLSAQLLLLRSHVVLSDLHNVNCGYRPRGQPLPELPVVLLEVQMHPDPGFHHRLAVQTYRFLQHHPRVEHWAVAVITPHSRLSLGPTQALQQFLEQVAWLNLEELSRRTPLDPLLNLLTLPIRPESDLAASSQQILASRPDLEAVVLPSADAAVSGAQSGGSHGDCRHPPRGTAPHPRRSGVAGRGPAR